MVNAAALADRLPDRPLSRDEAQDIADALDASIQTVSYQTENGTEYVPAMFLFVPDDSDEVCGDAVGLHMDDEISEWSGEVQASNVTRDKWLKVNELWAEEMGIRDRRRNAPGRGWVYTRDSRIRNPY